MNPGINAGYNSSYGTYWYNYPSYTNDERGRFQIIQTKGGNFLRLDTSTGMTCRLREKTDDRGNSIGLVWEEIETYYPESSDSDN